jgi:asparagine synthetase B (glutamine-hydrolysing)
MTGFTMGLAKSEAEWAERASAFLKAKLKESEVTYVELAKRLKKHGFAETEASVTNKLKRGTFSATFFLACLAAMELEGVALGDI